MKNGGMVGSSSYATTIATDTSPGLRTSSIDSSSVSELDYDAVASDLRSFDDHRSKISASLLVNTAELRGNAKLKSKFST